MYNKNVPMVTMLYHEMTKRNRGIADLKLRKEANRALDVIRSINVFRENPDINNPLFEDLDPEQKKHAEELFMIYSEHTEEELSEILIRNFDELTGYWG